MAEKSAKPVTSIEHIPAAEHGKGFPPFNPETFASQFVWLVLAFGLLYLLMSRVALPRISGIFSARSGKIADDLSAAQQLKEQSDAAIAAYEKALAEARGRAQILANETREKYAAEAEAARKELDALLNTRIAEAEKIISASRNAVMANVQVIASEAAASIVERLTGNAPVRADIDKAVAESVKR